MASLLSKERIVATASFNRWWVPAASVAIHLCIGSVYAWSIYNPALIRVFGVVTPAAQDWSLAQTNRVFTIAIVFLGLSAALAGKWLEDVGPRKVGSVAALCWGGGYLVGGLGIELHQLWLVYLGYGVIELDAELSAPSGALSTVMFAGPAGTLTPQIVIDDRRRITSEAKLRYFNAASQFTTATELVLLPPGTTDQATVAPTTVLGAPALTDLVYSKPGEYDLLFRETGTNIVRAGPIHVNLADGGIYGIITLNGPDTATARVVFIDDTP